MRQSFKPGLVFSIGDAAHPAWGVMLDRRPYFAFYKSDPLSSQDLIKNPEFIVALYHSSFKDGDLGEPVGTISRVELPRIPLQYVEDALKPGNYSVMEPDGTSWGCTEEEAKGLERAAVWEAAQVLERLADEK